MNGAAVPAGTALAGAILAVAALCATAVLGASLSHLTASPELYGDPFQAFFSWSGPGERLVPAWNAIRRSTGWPGSPGPSPNPVCL